MLITALLFVAANSILRPHTLADALFAPDPGLKVERTAHGASTFELEEWSVVMNGQPVPGEYLPSLEVKGHDETYVRTLDTYLACADGKPTRVRRVFESLSAKETFAVAVDDTPTDSSERTGSSALQGCVVLLDENAGDGERRKLEQGECEQSLVDALAIDLDLTEFTPTDSRADAWEVPASALNLFDERWGGVEFTYDEPAERARSDPDQLARNVEGNWRVVRGEPREEGGVRVLPLAVTGKLTTHSEIDGELENVPVASGPTTELAEMTIEVKGELLWNLEQRVLHSASLEGATTTTHKTRTKQESQPGTPVYQQDMTFRGTLTIAVETKVGD